MKENPKRILVVEDDVTWQERLKLSLENEGYSVQIATSSDEALVRLRRKSFDLVVIDLKLNPWEEEDRFSGMALLDRINQMTLERRLAGIPTKVLTAYGTPALAQEALEKNGVFGFNNKTSFDSRKFIEEVKEVIARRPALWGKIRSWFGEHIDELIVGLLGAIIVDAIGAIINVIRSNLTVSFGVLSGAIRSNLIVFGIIFVISFLISIFAYGVWKRRRR